MTALGRTIGVAAVVAVTALQGSPHGDAFDNTIYGGDGDDTLDGRAV